MLNNTGKLPHLKYTGIICILPISIPFVALWSNFVSLFFFSNDLNVVIELKQN